MTSELEVLKELVDQNRLAQRLNLGRFLEWAIYQKDYVLDRHYAYKNIGGYVIPLPAGATVTITLTNPADYVWIPHLEEIDAEVGGKIAVVQSRDGDAFYTHPGVPPKLINDFTQSVPWIAPGMIRATASAAFTNNDTVERWVTGAWIATYVLADEWDKYLRDVYNSYPVDANRDWKKKWQ